MKGLALGLVASLLAAASVAQPPRSFADLQAAARAGNADAQFRLGEAYRTGSGVPTDRDQAITWLKRASDQGSQPARDALGMLLFTRGNRQEAMPLIEAAAARGDARALYILATARFNGDYVARDWPRAFAEMSRAAELGLPQAQSSLAQMEPYLLPADRAKAEQIRATMAAAAPVVAAPAVAPTALPAPAAPRAVPPEPSRIAATPIPVAADGPQDAGLGLPIVPARGASGPAFTLAPSGNTPRAPAPPLPTSPSPAPPPVATVTSAAAMAPARSPARVSATAAAPVVRGKWRVQLGAYGSHDRAETQWAALAAKYPALGRHGHAITPVGALFRLQAEDVAGRDEAASLCRDIVAAGGGCFALAP